MLRFIGGVVLVGAIAFAVGLHFGVVSGKANVQVTQHGKQEIQNLRDLAADEIRGK